MSEEIIKEPVQVQKARKIVEFHRGRIVKWEAKEWGELDYIRVWVEALHDSEGVEKLREYCNNDNAVSSTPIPGDYVVDLV